MCPRHVSYTIIYRKVELTMKYRKGKRDVTGKAENNFEQKKKKKKEVIRDNEHYFGHYTIQSLYN